MHGEGIIHGDLKGVGLETLKLLRLLIRFSKGQHPDRSTPSCMSRRLRTYRHHLRLSVLYNVNSIASRWHDKVDESRTSESYPVWYQG